MLFGWTGALRLAIGAFLTLPHAQPADLPYEVALSLSSGAAPWIALALCRRYLTIPGQLSALRTTHVIIASIATAVVNCALVTACMAIADRWNGDTEQVAVIFVGDVLGAAIVVALVALLARLISRDAR